MEVKKWRIEGMFNTRIMSDTGLIAVCDVEQPDYHQNAILIAAAPQTAHELSEAKARIKKLENALMDALDQNEKAQWLAEHKRASTTLHT